MAYGGSGSKRNTTTDAQERPRSLVGWVATAASAIGLLNKGSAKAPAVPAAGDVVNPRAISTNTLNVTRVGGVATLIAAAGGAALVLFNVNKTKDRAPVVVAAYLSVGAIVVAALFTVAIIIAADVRARSQTTSAAAGAATPASPKAPALRTDVKYVQSVAVAPPAGGAPPDYVVSLDRAYDYVLLDAKAASMVLMLPSTNTAPWQQMMIKRQDNTNNNVTIRPQARETIAEESEHALLPANPIQIYSNGYAWVAID